MACWKCEACGWKNCDSDDCMNPKCVKKKAALKEQTKQLEKTLDGRYDNK